MTRGKRSDPSLAPGMVQLRTAAWYGDRQITLGVPPSWKTTVFAPTLGAPLSDEDIRERLESPVGQPPIRELCAGKRRPLVIVDDLNRPTPASRVVPLLLRHFEEAGIPPNEVRILMAPGTHGRPLTDALEKKVGKKAASMCSTRVHDCDDRLIRVGRTSFGTPVLVAREIVESDFIVGVGGLYPNHTGGFGGGSKLALGVLGFRSIANLHYRHRPEGWGSANMNSTFRRDLDEIARLIGLNTTVSLCIDGDRNVIDLTCGDHQRYFPELVKNYRDAIRAPIPPSEAHVVISNTYPMDLSLTFARMKGMLPLRHTAPDASRIAIAACTEGLGVHRLFPYMNAPKNHGRRTTWVRMSIELTRPRSLTQKAVRRVSSKIASKRRRTDEPSPGRPIWLYCPDPDKLRRLPADLPDFRITASWDEVLDGVMNEQASEDEVEAVVYPCAAIQWLA